MIKRIFAFSLAALLMLAVMPTGADAVLLSFDPLSNPNGTAYTGHTELGFTVSAIFGNWYEGHLFGNGTPSIFQSAGSSPSDFGPAAGTIKVEQGGAVFRFDTVDIGDAGGTDSNLILDIQGLLNNNVVFSHFGINVGVAAGDFATVINPSSGIFIDDLRIKLTDPTGTTSNIDNIDINNVPEPGTLMLLGAGLLGGGLRLRRRRNA